MNTFVVGHRGACTLVPENTLPSFRAALEIGVNELELDLRATRDGQVVVIHDASVDRTTDGTGLVSELTFEQVRGLDAGDGAQVPTFAEVLDATTGSLQVEIKDPRAIDPMMAVLRDRPEAIARLAPTSFDEGSVGRLVQLLPDVCVGLISKEASGAVLDRAAELGAGRVLVGLAAVTAEFVRRAHDRGFRVDVWPVDTPDQVRRAVALDADGFTTDDPRIVAEAGFRVTDEGLVPVG